MNTQRRSSNSLQYHREIRANYQLFGMIIFVLTSCGAILYIVANLFSRSGLNGEDWIRALVIASAGIAQYFIGKSTLSDRLKPHIMSSVFLLIPYIYYPFIDRGVQTV